jgi:hypothetical protein
MGRAALLACLCLPSLWAQGSALVSAESPQKLLAKRGAAAQAKIAVAIQPGYHVNSNTPSESYLIPLRLTWTSGALEPGEVVFPKPRMEKYEFSEKPISVFTGDFNLIAKFQTPANAPAGPGVMVGKLRYQACNQNACFPPKTVEVRLPYQIQ